MLTEININGLAIIESLSIQFSERLNVITGETGAGKSILIKALSFLLGAKTGADFVRKGANTAAVSATFKLTSDHKSLEIIENLGLPKEDVEDEGFLLVRRQINNKGRSQAWINDVPVTVSSLRALGIVLIDIFSQHENQRLLDSTQHIEYVDQFLSNKSVKQQFTDHYRIVAKRVKEITVAVEEYRKRKRGQDYLVFRKQELDAFGPSKDDYVENLNLAQKASEAISVRDEFKKVIEVLNAGFNGSSLSSALWFGEKVLDGLLKQNDNEEIQKVHGDFKELCIAADDCSFQIETLASKFETDDGLLEEANDRLSLYQEFFRKLSIQDIDGLLQIYAEISEELECIHTGEERILSMLKCLSEEVQHLQKLAVQLTSLRVKSASKIKRLIRKELEELNMKGSRFEIDFKPQVVNVPDLDFGELGDEIQNLWHSCLSQLTGIGKKGAEKAQFLLSANPGEQPRPIEKVASGGEVSRIMLGFKKVLAASAETCVLVFDEIDSGISGRAADVVGRKLMELSEMYQVICISHLPQVAAYSDSHLLVEKVRRKNRTESKIYSLDSEKSAREIARLLSGTEITKPSIENAKTLVARASDFKNSR